MKSKASLQIIGRLTLAFMMASVPSMSAYATETVLSIGDGPLDVAVSSSAELASMQDGSMIPEYTVTNISETSANIVSESYATAGTSTAVDSADNILEIGVTTMGGSSYSTGSATTESASSTSNTVTAIGTASTGSSSVINAGPISSGTSTGFSVVSNKMVVSGAIADSETKTSVVNASSKAATTNMVATNTISFGPAGSAEASASVTTLATTASRQAIINYAKQFLGNPYVYGGTSLTEGADCSGFVQSIFGHFGITTGRSSRDQYAKCQKITFAELQPGDLVFYEYGGSINHVAIYCGSGIIIHAASSATGICTSKYNFREPNGYGRFITD